MDDDLIFQLSKHQILELKHIWKCVTVTKKDAHF